MQFSKACKIHKTAAKDAGRYAMNHASLLPAPANVPDPTRHVLAATNGKALAIVPVMLDRGDTPGLVPTDAIREALKGPKATGAKIEANGTIRARSRGTVVEMARPDGDFPRIDAAEVLKPHAPGSLPTIAKGTTAILKLDARLLYALAEALGTEKVRLQLELEPGKHSDVRSAIRVEPLEGDEPDAVGAIMPIVVT